jgi:hypothetical protein
MRSAGFIRDLSYPDTIWTSTEATTTAKPALICHCEKRSDEAIPKAPVCTAEIASLRSQ